MFDYLSAASSLRNKAQGSHSCALGHSSFPVTLVSSVDGGSFITCAGVAPMALVPSLQHRVEKQAL